MSRNAWSLRSSGIAAGIARPAPPVGQDESASAPGRKDAPNGNREFLVAALSRPVEATAQAAEPALNGATGSVATVRKPSSLKIGRASCREGVEHGEGAGAVQEAGRSGGQKRESGT